MSAPMRSLTYVPGHRQRMVDRALALGEFAAGALDVAILDVEDGVPMDEKEGARRVIAACLGRPSRGGPGPLRYVRLNPATGLWLQADLRAAVRAGLAGVVLPKVESGAEVASLARALDGLERQSALDAGAVRILPSLESGRGLIEAYAIAPASPRVVGLLFGAEDYALDLGLPADRTEEAAELLYARSALVNAAAAAHVLAFDGVWPAIDDPDGLRRDAAQGRRLGFAGKSAIHPNQVGTINEIFSPSAEEVVYARRVLRAFDEAEARGDGAAVLDGKMLDRPVVERARRVIEIAR